MRADKAFVTIVLGGFGGFIGVLLFLACTAVMNLFIAVLLLFSFKMYLAGVVCGITTQTMMIIIEEKLRHELPRLARFVIGIGIAAIPAAIWYYLQYQATQENSLIVIIIAISFALFVGVMPISLSFRNRRRPTT
jgi:uncharacterized membrane protein